MYHRIPLRTLVAQGYTIVWIQCTMVYHNVPWMCHATAKIVPWYTTVYHGTSLFVPWYIYTVPWYTTVYHGCTMVVPWYFFVRVPSRFVLSFVSLSLVGFSKRLSCLCVLFYTYRQDPLAAFSTRPSNRLSRRDQFRNQH